MVRENCIEPVAKLARDDPAHARLRGCPSGLGHGSGHHPDHADHAGGVSSADRASALGADQRRICQVLRRIRDAGRFLWIPELARPDFWLAIIAAAATMVMMASNPGLPENLRAVLNRKERTAALRRQTGVGSLA